MEQVKRRKAVTGSVAVRSQRPERKPPTPTQTVHRRKDKIPETKDKPAEVAVEPAVVKTPSSTRHGFTIEYIIFLSIIIVVLVWAWSDTKSEARALAQRVEQLEKANVKIRRDIHSLVSDLETGRVIFHDNKGQIIPAESVTLIANGYLKKLDADQISVRYK